MKRPTFSTSSIRDGGLTRRQLLATAAAATAAGAAGGLLQARTLSPVGAQLYTLRNVLPKQPAETLKALESIGFREVEVILGGIDKIWDSLKQTSLKPVSLHMDTQLFTKDAEKLPAALEDAKKRGFRYVVCPYIAPQDRGGADVIQRLAETLNKAGEQCRKMGLKLCYHNHAFEFAPAGDGKGTLLDVLMKNADAKLVGLELDIMWVKVAGFDPVKVIEQYQGRVDLMHLKNVAADVQPRFNEGVPRTAFKEVGNGSIAIGPVLKAAKKAKVRHFFVEQDQTPGDPLASLKQSYEYLKTLDF